MLRIAINGCGRIGRLVLKEALSNPKIEVVAINELMPLDNLAYLCSYDSTHGRSKHRIEYADSCLIIDDQQIPVFAHKDPRNLPWKALNVDCVIEATGLLAEATLAQQHIEAGAKKVIVTAPGKKTMPTFVYQVNHTQYDPARHHVISNASCTTNCLAVIAKVLVDHFGIEEALMSTIHAVTASQRVVDAAAKKDFRSGRSVLQNIIPATTGAAEAVTEVLPSLKGKLTGMAFRVPVADVSVVDLTVKLSKPTSYAALCEEMERASCGALKDVLAYCDEDVVSSDFISSSYSAIFDAKAGIALNERFFKLVAWYDNERGYACRVLDLAQYITQQRG